MIRTFIDTVSNRFPNSRVDVFTRNCIRVSLLMVYEPGRFKREEFLIMPQSWRFSKHIEPYLRATKEDFDNALTPHEAYERLLPHLLATEQFVAFGATYHQSNLQILCRQIHGDLNDVAPVKWRCMMKEAAQLIGARYDRRREGRPTLRQAYEALTGGTWTEKTEWDEVATQHVFAVKKIFETIERRQSEGTA